MKRILKLIGSRLMRLYSKFDPLAFQKHYAAKTLRTKRQYVNFEQLDGDSAKRVKKLWGRKNPWHSFYYTIGNKSVAHLYYPDDWFYERVDSRLNDWKIAPVIDDKNLYDLFFYDVPHPRVIARLVGGMYEDSNYNIISFEEVIRLCEEEGKVIVKVPYGSSGGHGIKFWSKDTGKSLVEILSSMKTFVIQEIVTQHEALSYLHPNSLNTVRVMTMTDGVEVKALSAIVRMGVGDSKVDNVSSGGIACGVNIDGSLKNYAFDGKGRRYDVHPQGAHFEDIVIPHFGTCIELCKKLAPRVARFSKLISWDFAIDADAQPLLIEANLYGGELDFHQMCNGPIFGDEETTKQMIKRFV